MQSEFHKVTSLNDNKGHFVRDADPSNLREAKRDRRRASSVQAFLMESAMMTSKQVLAAAATRLESAKRASSPEASNIPQVDGGDSPSDYVGKHQDRKRAQPGSGKDEKKSKRKEKNVYEPLSVSDKRFVRYVEAVVDAVSEEVELKVSTMDGKFDPKDVMQERKKAY